MYRLILLDYSMPDMDGLETAMHLNTLFKSMKLPKPYICCVTAYTDPSYKVRALSAGMNDLLQKPVHIDDIKYLI